MKRQKIQGFTMEAARRDRIKHQRAVEAKDRAVQTALLNMRSKVLVVVREDAYPDRLSFERAVEDHKQACRQSGWAFDYEEKHGFLDGSNVDRVYFSRNRKVA